MLRSIQMAMATPIEVFEGVCVGALYGLRKDFSK